MGETAILEIYDYKDFADRSLGKEKTKESSVAQRAEKALKGSQKSSPDEAAENLKGGKILVQYNPSSIKLSGREAETASAKDADMESIPYTGMVDMSVELVFYQKEPGDTSVSDNMKLLVKMIKYSTTRKVIFSWGDQNITGVVTSFNGKYDMFDSQGQPVSGKISLSIQSQVSTSEINRILDKDIL